MPDAGAPGLDGSLLEDAETPAPEDAAASDTGVPLDDSAFDGGGDGDGDGDGNGDADAGEDAGDAGTPSIVNAVIGARCAISERIGLIEVAQWDVMPTIYGEIFDRPSAAYGAPELEDEACAFYRTESSNSPGCASCDYAVEICSASRTCAPAPKAKAGAVITVVKGASTQHIPFTIDSNSFYTTSELALPFGLEVALGAETVVLAESDIPSGLTVTGGTLTGDYDVPEAIDITWSSASEGSVFTHVPINHHAGGLTYTNSFTECAVPATAGALHIDGDMLTPLAVRTGLEFQGIEHVLFAAAETAAGCVEIRYSAHYIVNF